MSGSEKRIKVSNIANYYENPRHPIASDEFDTLKKLFDSVGIALRESNVCYAAACFSLRSLYLILSIYPIKLFLSII